MKQKRQINSEPMFIVINKYGEVFAGLQSGYPQWSSNWNEAKFLFKNNTSIICRDNPKNYELINENEL